MIKRVATALVVAICIAGCSSTTTSSSPSRPTTAATERKATTTAGSRLPSCPAAVDAVAAAAAPDTASVAVDNAAAYLSFRACDPNNGANGASDWETWANYDHIPKGSTDVHDVLAVYCQNADPHRTTNVCQDSIIVGLTNAMNIFNVYIPGL